MLAVNFQHVHYFTHVNSTIEVNDSNFKFWAFYGYIYIIRTLE